MTEEEFFDKLKKQYPDNYSELFNFLEEHYDPNKWDDFIKTYDSMSKAGKKPDIQVVWDNVTAHTKEDAVAVLQNSGDNSYETAQEATKVAGLDTSKMYETLLERQDDGTQKWQGMSPQDLASYANVMGYNIYNKSGDASSGIRTDVMSSFMRSLTDKGTEKDRNRVARGEWGDVSRALKNGNVKDAAYEIAHNLGGAAMSVLSPRVQEAIVEGRDPTMKDYVLDEVQNVAEAVPISRLVGAGSKVGGRIASNTLFPYIEAAAVPFGMEGVDALAYDADENPYRSDFSLGDAVVGLATNLGTPVVVKRVVGKAAGKAGNEGAVGRFRNTLNEWGDDPMSTYQKNIDANRQIMENGYLQPNEVMPSSQGKPTYTFADLVGVSSGNDVRNAENILAVDAALRNGQIDPSLIGLDGNGRRLGSGIPAGVSSKDIDLSSEGVIRTTAWPEGTEPKRVLSTNTNNVVAGSKYTPDQAALAEADYIKRKQEIEGVLSAEKNQWMNEETRNRIRGMVVPNEEIAGKQNYVMQQTRMAYEHPEGYTWYREDGTPFEPGATSEPIVKRNQAIAKVLDENPWLETPDMALVGLTGKDRSFGAGSLGFVTNKLGEQQYGYDLLGALPYGSEMQGVVNSGWQERENTKKQRASEASAERRRQADLSKKGATEDKYDRWMRGQVSFDEQHSPEYQQWWTSRQLGL